MFPRGDSSASMEREPCRLRVRVYGECCLWIHIIGHRFDLPRVAESMFRPRPAAAGGEPDHQLANRQVATPGRGHPAEHLESGGEGIRRDGLIRPTNHEVVREVDRCGQHLHAD